MEMNEFLEHSIGHIKTKKELEGISEDFVKGAIAKVARQNPKMWTAIVEKIENGNTFKQIAKTRNYEEFFKLARALLRKQHGMFQSAKNDAAGKAFYAEEKYRELLELLQAHSSTRERIENYDEIYDFLFEKLAGKKDIKKENAALTLIDIGAGNNSASSMFWKSHYPGKIKYLGYDISKNHEDCARIAAEKTGYEINCSIFDFSGIADGKNLEKLNETISKDAKELEIKLPFDACLIWKTLDVLEDQKRGITRTILAEIPARYFFISFATRSLGQGKKIRKSSRNWFLNLLRHNGNSYDIFEIYNEIFFLVKSR